MESELIIWQVAAIAIAAGIFIGILGYRLFAPDVKQADKVQSELDQARDELNRYRAEVDSHFSKTSELVNDLTQDYVRVYQHLAEGVQTLGNGRSFTNLLEQQPGRVVLTVDDADRVADPGPDDAPAAAATTAAPAAGPEESAPDEAPADEASKAAVAAEVKDRESADSDEDSAVQTPAPAGAPADAAAERRDSR